MKSEREEEYQSPRTPSSRNIVQHRSVSSERRRIGDRANSSPIVARSLKEENLKYFFSSSLARASLSINVSVLLTHFGVVYMVDGLINERCVEKTGNMRRKKNKYFFPIQSNGEEFVLRWREMKRASVGNEWENYWPERFSRSKCPWISALEKDLQILLLFVSSRSSSSSGDHRSNVY